MITTYYNKLYLQFFSPLDAFLVWRALSLTANLSLDKTELDKEKQRFIWDDNVQVKQRENDSAGLPVM